jgi:hypothetical protein
MAGNGEMSRRYKKVSQSENDDDVDETTNLTTQEDESKKQIAERLEQISIKIHALFWVFAAVGLGFYLDVFHVALTHHKVNRYFPSLFPYLQLTFIRIFLNLAFGTFFANLCIVFYLTIWLPLIQKVTIPWDIYCPRMIPAATFLGVVCLVSLVMAFWPVWGFFSPLFISVFFLGLIFGTHFIPWPC